MEATGKREGIPFPDEFNCASESLRPILLQLLQHISFDAAASAKALESEIANAVNY